MQFHESSSHAQQASSNPDGIPEVWSALSAAHHDMNARARRDPNLRLSATQKQTLQALFRQVHAVLHDNPVTSLCNILSDRDDTTVGDALILLGQHRAAIRSYRVNVLGEDPFVL